MTIPALSTPFKWVAITVGCLALAWMGLSVRSCAKGNTMTAQTAIADQHATSAAVAHAQEEAYGQEAQAQKPTLQSDSTAVDRLRSERDKLKAELARINSQPVQPPDAAQPVDNPPDLAPLVAKDEELIGALTKENTDLKAHVVTLNLQIGSLQVAFDEKSKEAVAIRIALEAQVAANKAERWRGRIEGFVVGIGAGYVAGKL